MDDAELRRASEHERALYEELAGTYRALAAVLGDEGAPLDGIATQQRRAEVTAEAIRAVAARIAPRRFGGVPVEVEIQSLWRSSAELAASALETNRELQALARARQDAVAGRLGRLTAGAHGLRGYRASAELAPVKRA
jgi:hypothetical protein